MKVLKATIAIRCEKSMPAGDFDLAPTGHRDAVNLIHTLDVGFTCSRRGEPTSGPCEDRVCSLNLLYRCLCFRDRIVDRRPWRETANTANNRDFRLLCYVQRDLVRMELKPVEVIVREVVRVLLYRPLEYGLVVRR